MSEQNTFNALPVDFKRIPQRLKDLPSWVVWKAELRGGKWTKPPISVKTGKLAKVNDASTWATFAEAKKAYEKGGYDGVGLVIPEGSGLVGLDFDKCIDKETGAVEPWAVDAIYKIGSYTEHSPSGRGLRVFVEGQKNIPASKRGRFEAYDRPGSRYLTATGALVAGLPDTIEPRQEALDELLRRVFVTKDILPEEMEKQPKKGAPAQEAKQPDQQSSKASTGEKKNEGPRLGALSDEEALQRAIEQTAFRNLWEGKHSGDASAADLSLCNHLAFWCAKDAGQMDRLFRQSGLMRPKWDEKRGASTYGEKTISRAIADCQEAYSRGYRQDQSQSGKSSTGEKTQEPGKNEFRGFRGNFEEEIFLKNNQATKGLHDSNFNFEYFEDQKQELKNEWPEELIPLDKPHTPLFPVEVLPCWLGNMAQCVAASTETPVDLAAMAGLGALAAACSGWLDISPSFGWTEPLNLYSAAAYPSGAGKSPVWKAMHWPVAKVDRAAFRAWNENQHRREAQALSLKADIQAHKKEKERPNDEQLEELLRQLGNAEGNPPQLTTEDATPEALLQLMAANAGILAVLSPEGHLFTQLAGLYSGGQANLNLVLKAHSGDSIMSNRVGRSPTAIERPLLTLCLGIQPHVLREAGQNKAFRGTGLVARFLIAMPASTVGDRHLELTPINENAQHIYNQSLGEILDKRAASLAQGETATLLLSEDARNAFLAYRRLVEKDRGPGGALSHIADWAGKIDGHVLRLAGLLHVAENYALSKVPSLVEAPTLEAATVLMDYFIAHAKAAFFSMVPDATETGAQRILEWLRRQNKPQHSERDFYQGVRKCFDSKDEFLESANLLSTWGYVKNEIPATKTGRGRKPSGVWNINPAIFR